MGQTNIRRTKTYLSPNFILSSINQLCSIYLNIMQQSYFHKTVSTDKQTEEVRIVD